MKVLINSKDSLPEGEYILTDPSKIERAKGKLPLGASDRDILLKYDELAGRIISGGNVLPPQGLRKIENRSWDKPLEEFSNDELLNVIRRAENSDISGSLFQKAKIEWELRQDQKNFDAIKRKKWTSDNTPIGYPRKCSSDQIREVIQDLSDEKYNKLQGGKVNTAWEKIIDDHIKNGERELDERREVRHWYEKPLGIVFIGVIIFIIGFLLTNILSPYLKKDTYVGFYYPDANNLTNDIQSNNNFSSLEACRVWIDKQISIHNSNGLNYDYECGKNCDLSGGKPYVCDETLE